jgi:hypothetical protein
MSRRDAKRRLQVAGALLGALLLALGFLLWNHTSATVTSAGLIKPVGRAATFESTGAAAAMTRAPAGLAAGDVLVSYLETPSDSQISCSAPSAEILDQRHGSTRLAACLTVVGTSELTGIRATIIPRNQVTMVTHAFSGVDPSKPVDGIAESASGTSPRVVTNSANDEVVYGEGSSGHSASAHPLSGARLAASINDASTSQVAVATHAAPTQGVTAPVRWTMTPTSSSWPAAAVVALRAAPVAASAPSSPAASPTHPAGSPSATPRPTPSSSSSTVATGAALPGKAPTEPPVAWCENGLPASPYTSAPAGAVTVPAGDNTAFFQYQMPANTTYWFAPGSHATGEIETSDDDTFLGAPGAIITGENDVPYAFEGPDSDTSDEHVTIEYLTIEDFDPMQGGGAVNGNGNNGWTEEYDLMEYNSPGAAMMLGGDNTVSNNCLTENGEYGFNGASFVDGAFEDTFTGGATNITFTGNDVSYNNTQKTSSGVEGGGKFWQDGDVTVTGNYFHNNYGSPGAWMDTDNAGFLVQDNYFSANGAEGLVFEISYNADIIDNTFVDNGIDAGPQNPGFPTGAIYISESGGNSSVPSTYAGELNIQDNVFNDNYGGVVLYQNSNRYSGDGQDPGTLTPPSGVDIGTWISTEGPADCPGNLSETSPIDYHSLCQWRTQNVTVQDNQFTFDPSDSVYGGQCTEANSCGQNALFGTASSTPAYPGFTECNAISNDQDNVFSDNTYTGPWSFLYFNQGDVATWSQWTSGLTNVEDSGFNFGAQDSGSTFSQ